jgi:glycosyltransferase involved in cell wall biosynthesis
MRSCRPAVTNVGTPKAGLLAGLAAWFARVPCRIYTLRGLRLETATGLQRMLLYLTEWVACRAAHRVVCVSPSLLRRAEGLRLVAPGRGVVLGSGSSNGIDVDRFLPSPQRRATGIRLRADLGLPDDALVVGFVGRLARDKGVVELVEAYRQLTPTFPQLRLLLLGEPEPGDPLPADTHAALESLPGVVRPGFVADTADWYHVMDVVALPTYREGFPNVLLEAAAAGKPVVTTTATGAVDAVLAGMTGHVVPPRDVAALRTALGALLAAPDEAARMGRRGQEWVSGHFRSHNVWRSLGDLYDELLGSSPTEGTA